MKPLDEWIPKWYCSGCSLEKKTQWAAVSTKAGVTSVPVHKEYCPPMLRTSSPTSGRRLVSVPRLTAVPFCANASKRATMHKQVRTGIAETLFLHCMLASLVFDLYWSQFVQLPPEISHSAQPQTECSNTEKPSARKWRPLASQLVTGP